MCVHLRTGSHRVQKKTSENLHLELIGVLSNRGAALKLRFSGKAASVSNYWEVLSATPALVLKHIFKIILFGLKLMHYTTQVYLIYKYKRIVEI